ncbi:MAG: 4Fe-4S binding protein [Candidatus Hodarchaeales archaeon]
MARHNKPKTKLTKLRLFRTVIQVIMFFLMNLTFFLIGATWLVLPVNMPRSIFSTSEGAFFLLQRMLSLAILPLIPLAIFFLIGAVFGRLFCAWACPFGLFQDLLGFLTSWIRKYEPTQETNLNYRQIGEFLTGATIFVSTFIGINVALGERASMVAAFDVFFSQPWAVLSPSTFLFTNIPLLFWWGGIENFFIWEKLITIDLIFWVRLIVFVFTVILVIYIPRGWCRWFCPVGSIMGILGKNSLLGIGRNISKCSRCNLCEDICPMGVRVLSHPPEKVRSEHCINCLDCVAICPDDAMEIKLL